MKQGDLVLALDGIQWREAYLERQKPYGCNGRRISDGWYIRWKELPKPPEYDPYYMPSQGGWKSINCIKELA